MANKKVSQLPAIDGVLDPADVFYVVRDGQSRSATLQQMATAGTSETWVIHAGGTTVLGASTGAVRATAGGTIKAPHTSNYIAGRTKRILVRNASEDAVTVSVGDTPDGEDDDAFDDGSTSFSLEAGSSVFIDITGENIWSVFTATGAPSPSDYDPDAVEYFDRVDSAGGTLDLVTKLLVSNAVVALKGAGIWTKIRRCNLFCTDGFTGLRVPLVVEAGDALDTLTNFVSGDYSLTGGLKGDGSTKYVKHGITFSTSGMTSTNIGMHVYMVQDDASTCAFGGAYDGSANTFALHVDVLGAPTAVMQCDFNAASQTALVENKTLGMWSVSVSGGAMLEYHRGSRMKPSTTAVTGALPGVEPFILARNVVGTPDYFNSGAIGCYLWTTGLSAAQELALYNILQAFNEGLGREYSQTLPDISCWGDSLTAPLTGYVDTNMNPAAWADHRNARNLGIGGENSSNIRTRFFADPSGRNTTTVIWAGTNNIMSVATVLADIQAMVTALENDHFLVLMPLPFDDPANYIGGANRATIESLRSALATLYPSNFYDAQQDLVDHYDSGIPQDVIDHDNGITPSSLRDGVVHLNFDGNNIVASAIYTRLVANGW